MRQRSTSSTSISRRYSYHTSTITRMLNLALGRISKIWLSGIAYTRCFSQFGIKTSCWYGHISELRCGWCGSSLLCSLVLATTTHSSILTIISCWYLFHCLLSLGGCWLRRYTTCFSVLATKLNLNLTSSLKLPTRFWFSCIQFCWRLLSWTSKTQSSRS